MILMDLLSVLVSIQCKLFSVIFSLYCIVFHVLLWYSQKIITSSKKIIANMKSPSYPFHYSQFLFSTFLNTPLTIILPMLLKFPHHSSRKFNTHLSPQTSSPLRITTPQHKYSTTTLQHLVLCLIPLRVLFTILSTLLPSSCLSVL
jgi:hypothetical protein